jgi:glycosyltransferase involved in cell wall biosynthesis
MIPNSVDTECFRPLEVEKKKKSIIFVGRFVPQKNLYALLRAVEKLDCSMTLVGDGPLRKELISFAARKKIVLEYHQQIPNEGLPLLLNQHDIFVLPSLYEGMPKALLEGMACGLCAVAARIDGVTDVIRDRVNGRLCSTRYDSIREVLRELLRAPELVKRYGKEACLSIERRFKLERIVEQEVEFYKNVLC